MSTMDDDFYEQMVETIMEAISLEDGEDLGYEIAIAVFPTEDTIKSGEPFPAAIKSSASPGLTGQVFISYLQTNPPVEEEGKIYIPDQGIVH